jgi:acyl-CoA synthetase (AMP-forming)/AMP-acid ligase II
VNVFPAEVEAVVSSHPAVREAVVVGVTDVRWGKRIHAVVVPIDPASPPSDAELERHCRARLAPPKVPKTFSLASEIPRSSVGKVRRREILERLERPAS